MASDLSSGCTETIDILDDEKEEGEISLEDVSSSEEGAIGHLTSSYSISRTRPCPDCKSWSECLSWCIAMYHSKSRRDPVKGKENRLYVKEAECITTKHAAPTLQQKNDDLVPISSDSDMEIVGLTDTSNRSKEGVKKKKRKKMKCKSPLTIDDLINPSGLPVAEFGPIKLYYKERSSVRRRLRADREQADSRSKVISRSPTRRHKSPVRSRSPIQLSRSPYSRRSRSPIHRRSPQRIRSPKRNSPYGSVSLKTARRSSKQDSSPSTRSHTDKRSEVTRLLKKVKFELNVNRSKEHQSSLKEKLSNMLNKASKSNKTATHFKEKSKVQSMTIDIDADDEEDLALLRQKALETKPKKSSKLSDYSADVELEKPSDAKDDDQDEEALNLRMIALQSAFVKKHQNRVQRGVKANKKVSRSESPFSQSFLDDIPVPSDELLKFASPPCTPPHDSNHAEDMDLDTDVEREKEKLPYSPTDKITSNVPIDTELLGIEPSDVSFISVNETNNTVFDDIKQPDPMSLSIAAPYYDNLHQYGELPQFYAYPSSQHSSETFLSDLNNESTELVSHISRDSHNNIVCDLVDGICCQERSYSSTGVIHMPDASHALPLIKDHNLGVASISPSNIYASPKVQQIEQPVGALFMNAGPTYTDDRCAYDTQTVHRYVTDSSATFTTGYSEPMSLNEPIPVNVLPDVEANQFGSPVEEAAPCQAAEGGTLKEPLYMQGVPDVTKDVNKIPTLINRTLVPVPLLRSNKQLQQLLPAMKKRETHPEPTFKSAEMQPVVITANATVMSGSNFKPIKLQPAKKPPPVLTTSVPFDNSMNEENEENDALEETSVAALPINNQETIELGHSVIDTAPTPAASTDVVLRKKRKRVKKKCKSLDTAQLFAEKRNRLCTNVNKDINIRNASSLEREIVEANQGKSNEVQEGFAENGESSSLQNVIDTQEPLSLNSSNIIVENRDVEKNDAKSEEEPKQALSVEDSEEKNTKSHTNSAFNNLDSGTLNVDEITKDVDRRQSVEEDEDELRAILLASLKRTKSDIICGTSAVSVTTSCTPTNTQASVQQKMSTNITVTVNTTCTGSNNVPLSSKLNLSESAAKKVNSTSISSLTGNRKRNSSIAAVKAPLKKLPKKAPIPASTKAVNNAKKYQNMMQRKLNLLKLNNAKSNENAWSNVNAPKTLHASDTQRFVIRLGSDTDSDSESEKRKVTSVTEKQQAQDAVGVDFEKSLQKFLRDMRKEQEQSASVVKPVLSPQGSKLTTQTNKSSSNMHTPLAVRHLPVSQQEEYRRLKQQILEREKLKLQKKVADNSNSNINNNSSNGKILNTNVVSSPLKSPCENKNVAQNQAQLKESEKDSQQSTEIQKKNVNVALKNTSALNVSADKNLSPNIVKHTNTTHLPAKGTKKTIPNNLSIRITNEVAPSHTAEKKTVENLGEKQSVSDKQQHRPALRALTKEEINRKYVQVQLKSDTIGRVVTINDKSALRHNTASSSQSVESSNTSVEILEEKDKNNENNNNDSTFSNASTVLLSSNLSTKKKEIDDTLETTMSRSQYEAECRREIANNISASSDLPNNNNNASLQFDINADDKNNTDAVWEALKKDVKAELGNLMNLSRADQEQYLKGTEHKLVARRYNVLDHLAEMSGNLRQWDMERDLQNCLTIEVKKLKEQLKVAEERLQMQRDRVNSMGPKVSTAREKINAGRRECFKLSRICSTLGNRLLGKNYKLPEAGGQLLSEKLKEVANHTRQFTKKKRIQFSDISETSSSCSSLSQQISSSLESARVMNVEEDLSLQEQPASDKAITDVARSKSHIFRSEESNDSESLSLSELSLDPPQTFPSHTTPVKRKENFTNASTNASLLCSGEQSITSQDSLHSVPKLSSTPIQEDNEVRRQKNSNTDISDPATSAELGSSDPSRQADEQNNMRTSPLPSLTTTTMMKITATKTTTTTATTITTTTTTTTIAPYVSILTHLKIPRNTNPHGILCPYEIMGICRDEDCQYIHQSRNQT